MHNYVKSGMIALIVALTAWDIACTDTASKSFIQQESNLHALVSDTAVTTTAALTSTQNVVNPNSQQSNNRQLVSNTRDYVNPNYRANQNYPIAQTTQQSNPKNTPSRDYMNANKNIPVGQTGLQTNSPNPKIPNTRRDYVNTNFPVAQTGQIPNMPNPRIPNSPTRDYVNPNYPVAQTAQQPHLPNPKMPNTVAQTGHQPNAPNPKYPNTPTRDYVNPNRPNQNIPIAQQGQQSNFPNNKNQQLPQIRTTPSPPRRDYVNPNVPKHDYIAPSYPSLPPNTVPTSSTAKPPISWAQKVSGGITTHLPPTATSKASAGSPTQQPKVTNGVTSTERRPDEGPTDAELREFSEALLRRDVNNAAKYITANVQGKTTSQSQNDQAPQPLLEIQAEAYQIPTIAKIRLLHNNYILETNENEYVTAQEKQEENALLDAMLTTPIMQYTRNFLVDKNKLTKDPKEFKNLLKVLWFNMYSRGGGRIGSSGFEHIFLAELKKNEVSGLHNWIYFEQAERANTANYLGYMKKIDLGEKGSILKFHFKLKGVDKPVGSMFIGTSPELEMALYTTCYLFRADRVCPLKLNGNHLIVRTYSFRYRGKNMIGSAFPEI